ncbi:TIGR03986 family CRISPR-associated RAMP protein [Nocardia sp. NPDC050697]|uniref:TIGR03986 family type III CRISPR-associated RAMP protein n=1 Tax=Nocardia sp. NPDC050697 TaxID=3155158 RepID=UPI0033E7C4A1
MATEPQGEREQDQQDREQGHSAWNHQKRIPRFGECVFDQQPTGAGGAGGGEDDQEVGCCQTFPVGSPPPFTHADSGSGRDFGHEVFPFCVGRNPVGRRSGYARARLLVITVREVVIVAQFVNPYTFVPFSGAPQRSAPGGHEGRCGSELLSGRLRVRISARTPVLVRGFGAVSRSDSREAAPSRPDRDGGREFMVPGSAVHGAVRSLHEAMTNSCLRVFDADLVPQYRQQADPYRIGQLRLAVVETPGEVTEGKQGPPVLRLCEEGDPVRHRLDQWKLAQLHAASRLRSGDRLFIDCDGDDRPVSATPAPDGDWVVFLSDGSARVKKRPYYAHVRRLTGHRVPVAEEAWRAYLELVEGSDDLRTARVRKVPETERFARVTYHYRPANAAGESLVVGQRHLVRRTVIAGQPLWVRVAADGRSADVVQPALIWRGFGEGSAGERIPEGFEPCSDPGDLCPSCRLFGSADVRGRGERERAWQRSYRGHVRFGDAVAVEPELLEVSLPPLGAPRPGSGQHYLETAQWAGDGGIPPLREWGSAADVPRRRLLRGRKFYWHTGVANGRLPSRGQARAGQDGEMVSHAQVFKIKTVFEATITFTDLDETALGSLLAALQPHRVLGDSALLHIGGGKPLGYGSCRIEIDHSQSWTATARERYTAVAPHPLSQARVEELVRVFASDQHAAPVREQVWPLLGKAVAMGQVPAGKVWYPPGAENVGDRNFARGFPYWKQTSGWESDRRDRLQGYPLQPLPDISAASQEIDIVTGEQQQRLRRRSR